MSISHISLSMYRYTHIHTHIFISIDIYLQRYRQFYKNRILCRTTSQRPCSHRKQKLPKSSCVTHLFSTNHMESDLFISYLGHVHFAGPFLPVVLNLIILVVFLAMRPRSEQSYQNPSDFYITGIPSPHRAGLWSLSQTSNRHTFIRTAVAVTAPQKAIVIICSGIHCLDVWPLCLLPCDSVCAGRVFFIIF